MSIQAYLSLFLVIIGIGEQKIVNGNTIEETTQTRVAETRVLDRSMILLSNGNVQATKPEYTFYQNLHPHPYSIPSYILTPPQAGTPYTSKQFGEIFNLINPGCSVSTPIGTLILPIRHAAFTTSDNIFRISPRFGQVFSNINNLDPSYFEYLPSPKQLNGILNLINPACSISTPIGTLVLPIRDSESTEVEATSPLDLDE
ncbi:hypothetical protein WA026_017901 [Henosepilachna vigintioctopunctata]|uniref:Uncharacterized protein n=1 Tax=Henosepilachna vigintioctopunctata TaxID=420089 RepID=A0AAW1TZA1_9CUCU